MLLNNEIKCLLYAFYSFWTGTGEPLAKIIASDSSSIGGSSSLPFLFKVLSITKPLSIQVHPNKVITSLQFNFSFMKNGLFDPFVVLLIQTFDKYFIVGTSWTTSCKPTRFVQRSQPQTRNIDSSHWLLSTLWFSDTNRNVQSAQKYVC